MKYPPALPMTIQKDAPPIFIAAATDDELHLVPMSIDLYNILRKGQLSESYLHQAKDARTTASNKKC